MGSYVLGILSLNYDVDNQNLWCTTNTVGHKNFTVLCSPKRGQPTGTIVSQLKGLFQDAYETIQKDKALILTRKVHFGAKIVRGAYMEKERKMAKEQGEHFREVHWTNKPLGFCGLSLFENNFQHTHLGFTSNLFDISNSFMVKKFTSGMF